MLAFYLLTLRAGQPWPDDFAMYVSEAKSFADHTPLRQNGYIYNPQNAGLGPKLYPPVFPVLLVPAYKLGGLTNLIPMQVEIVLFFAGLLVVLWQGLARDLPLTYRAALLGLVGFNPLLWEYKDSITSDIPFTFFLYLTFLLADRLTNDSKNGTNRVFRALALAILIYVCYGIRTMGILLVPALVLLGILHWKRNGRLIIGVAAMGLVPCAIQARLFGGEASYADQLKLGPLGFLTAVFHNVVTYGWSLSNFWDNPYSKAVRDAVLLIVTLLALVGYIRRLRTGPRIYEFFLPIYLAVVLLWPNPAGARYLIPLFPLYVCYLFEGVIVAIPVLRFRRTAPVFVPLLILICLSYGADFAHAEYGPFPDGMRNVQTTALFSYVRSNTAPSDVFVFRRPRAFSLFTGRNAAIYPEPKYASDFSTYFRSIHATYLIEAPSMDDAVYDRFIEGACPGKQLVFSNSDFRVFRLIPGGPLACCAQNSASSLITGLTNANEP